MNIRYMFILLIMFILTLSVVSASNVSEAIIDDGCIIENSYIDEHSYYYIDDLELKLSSFSENDNYNDYNYCKGIPYENFHNVDSSIEYFENMFKEYGYFCINFSYAEISTENISHQVINQIIEQPVTFNLNTLHDLDLEIHIFMSSYEEFRFYEPVDFDDLISNFNFVFFDYVISKDLSKDVIICAKKIKWDYVYSIDNLFSESFSLNILSDLNSFLNSHFPYSKSSVFYFKNLNGEYNEL